MQIKGIGEPTIVILGAGPTGLGAAYYLKSLGYSPWWVYERNAYPGGLAASFVDQNGFTWDCGGHVLFSHYPFFDQILNDALGNEFHWIERSAWVWLCNRFIPYPLQNNIHHLPPEIQLECLKGILRSQRGYDTQRRSDNFLEWMISTFGEGLTNYFMEPYNRKVWAHPLELMSIGWIGERVSVVDLDKVLESIVLKRDEKGWGPNARFRFPKRGGTGEIYRRLSALVQDHISFNEEAVCIHPDRQEITFASGRTRSYDFLLSTIPVDLLINQVLRDVPSEVREAAQELRHTTCHFVGVGINGAPPPGGRCWIYFPQPEVCFYRVTYFSFYSPAHVFDPGRQYSLLCEISSSPSREFDSSGAVQSAIDDLVKVGLLTRKDTQNIVTTWHHVESYAYPVPTLRRDIALKVIHEFLWRHNILSRGRFGAWKYEVGNMDHSVEQGKEAIDKILTGCEERLASF